MNVGLTPLAERDLDEYLALIARDDPAAALRVEARIIAALGLLAERPGLGARRRVRGLGSARVFAVTPLPIVAIYPESSDGVLILRWFHGARRPIVR